MNTGDVDEALRLHAQGWSLEDVGDHFGVCRQRVWNLVHDDPRYQPHSRGSGSHPKVPPAQIVAMFNAGAAPRNIARQLGVSPSTVHRALTRAGIRAYGLHATTTRRTP